MHLTRSTPPLCELRWPSPPFCHLSFRADKTNCSSNLADLHNNNDYIKSGKVVNVKAEHPKFKSVRVLLILNCMKLGKPVRIADPRPKPSLAPVFLMLDRGHPSTSSGVPSPPGLFR